MKSYSIYVVDLKTPVALGSIDLKTPVACQDHLEASQSTATNSPFVGLDQGNEQTRVNFLIEILLSLKLIQAKKSREIHLSGHRKRN